MTVRHLKIPVNFEEIPYDKRNLFVAFLHLQSFSPYGRIHISKVPRRKFHHWLNKLTGAGLISRDKDYYILKSNEYVWGILGIKRINYKGNEYRWRKLPNSFKSLKWSEFKRKAIEDIQSYQTERKKAQLRRRHKLAGNPINNKTSLFGAKAAARVFGYKSVASGSKYRDKWFDVVKEPSIRRMYFTSDGYPYYKFDCKKIYLKTIYH